MVNLYDNSDFHKAKRACFVFSSILLLFIAAGVSIPKLNLVFATINVDRPIVIYLFLAASLIYQLIVLKNRAYIHYASIVQKKVTYNIKLAQQTVKNKDIDLELADRKTVENASNTWLTSLNLHRINLDEFLDELGIDFSDDDDQLKINVKIKFDELEMKKPDTNDLSEALTDYLQAKSYQNYYTSLFNQLTNIELKERKAKIWDYHVPYYYSLIVLVIFGGNLIYQGLLAIKAMIIPPIFM